MTSPDTPEIVVINCTRFLCGSSEKSQEQWSCVENVCSSLLYSRGDRRNPIEFLWEKELLFPNLILQNILFKLSVFDCFPPSKSLLCKIFRILYRPLLHFLQMEEESKNRKKWRENTNYYREWNVHTHLSSSTIHQMICTNTYFHNSQSGCWILFLF